MKSIAEAADRLIDDQQEFVLATIVRRHGSAPRTAGTRMIVSKDGRGVGTIGGGLLEARVIRKAGDVFSNRRSEVVPFDLSHTEVAGVDMICGGELEVLLEFISPSRPAAVVLKRWREALSIADPCLFLTVLHFSDRQVDRIAHCLVKGGQVLSGDCFLEPPALHELVRAHCGATCMRTVTLGDTMILIDPVLKAETVYLFGGGHVAQPTARLAAFVGFRVRVVDDRAEFANAEHFPDAEEVRVVTDFDSALKGLAIDRSTFIVIVTRGHLHDQTVLTQALRTESAYIGMIGSRRKRDHIFDSLLKQGFTQSDLKRVHSPIGLDIGAETPEEIALSIVAELVKARARGRLA